MPLRLPKSRTARALLLLGLTATFALVMTGAVALLFPTQALGSSSTLEVLDGAVAVSRDGNTFVMGQDGDMLQEGDVIRTDADTAAADPGDRAADHLRDRAARAHTNAAADHLRHAAADLHRNADAHANAAADHPLHPGPDLLID